MNLGLEALRPERSTRTSGSMMSMEYIDALLEINRETCDLLLVVNKFENVADAFCNLVAVNNTVRRYGYTSSIEHMVGGNFRGGFSLEASEGASLNAFEKAWRWLKEMWRRFVGWLINVFSTDAALIKRGKELAHKLEQSKGMRGAFLCSKNFNADIFRDNTKELNDAIKKLVVGGTDDVMKAILSFGLPTSHDAIGTSHDAAKKDVENTYFKKVEDIIKELKSGKSGYQTLFNDTQGGYHELVSADYTKVKQLIEDLCDALENFIMSKAKIQQIQQKLDTSEKKTLHDFKASVVTYNQPEYKDLDDAGKRAAQDAVDAKAAEYMAKLKSTVSSYTRLVTESYSLCRRALSYLCASIKANKVEKSAMDDYKKAEKFQN